MAVVVNWRELHYDDFEIDLASLGIKLNHGDMLEVKDLYDDKELEKFDNTSLKSEQSYNVGLLYGHGCKALKFSVSKSASHKKRSTSFI